MGRLNRLLAPVTEILTPEQKWKLRLPVAIGAVVIGVGSFFWAYHSAQPHFYGATICMVIALVVALRVERPT